MTQEDLKKMKLYAELTNSIDKYVYLREDDKGKYIEYAFKEGAPHDNRCLSWYDSYQESAYIRNGWIEDINNQEDKEYLNLIKKKIDSRIDEIFELSSFTCGYEEHLESSLEDSKKSWEKFHPNEPFVPENHICRVGCPSKKCVENGIASDWTYDEPIKCACWYLTKAKIPKSVQIPIEMALKLEKEIKKE